MQPHQRHGLGFLFERHHRGGAILADEPGLGKTLQAVALVDTLVQAGLAGCVLIVAPAEMLATWAREFKRFLPPGAIDTTIISKDASRLAAADHLRRLASVKRPDHCVMIISYAPPPPSEPERVLSFVFHERPVSSVDGHTGCGEHGHWVRCTATPCCDSACPVLPVRRDTVTIGTS